MESNTARYIVIGAAAAAIVGGIFYIVRSSSKAGVNKRLLIEMKEEVSKIVPVPKYSHADGPLSDEYLLNVFYILTKYVALVQPCENEATFRARIQALKNGDDAKYETLVK